MEQKPKTGTDKTTIALNRASFSASIVLEARPFLCRLGQLKALSRR